MGTVVREEVETFPSWKRQPRYSPGTSTFLEFVLLSFSATQGHLLAAVIAKDMTSIDRRRNNGPQSSCPPIFDSPIDAAPYTSSTSPQPFFLRTSLIYGANGSSFYERAFSKIVVSVHGPRPLSKASQGYSPTAILSVDFKYAPFAAARRTGYLKTTRERAIGQLIATALQSSVLTKLYPKSEIALNILVLEEPADGELETIAASVTAASAAIADAGIECIDLVAGAVIRTPPSEEEKGKGLVIGYMPHREEMTMMYMTGTGDKGQVENMIADATEQAKLVNLVLNKVLTQQ